MSTPIIELIAENIKDAVNAITIGNGFNQDLTAIRPKSVDWLDEPPVDRTVLVLQAGEVPDDDKPQDVDQWIQTFLLSANVVNSEKATTAIETRINQVVSDIRKKLFNDPFRGGYAMDTTLRATEIFGDREQYCGANIQIDVQYRTKLGDPYVQG